MKLTIQLPISWVQYSNRIIVLEEDEQTPEAIDYALRMLKEVDKQYAGDSDSEFAKSKGVQTPTQPASSLSTEMIVMENAQLKKSQELSQQFMNIFKYKNPELFEEVCTLVDEENHDIATNAAVDDKLLESKK